VNINSKSDPHRDGHRSSSTVLVLVRHGETIWHGDNRYAGASSDIDLTPKGVQQAHDLAQWCSKNPPDAVFSSPVRRAMETASISAKTTGLPLRIVDDLREVDFGLAEGRTLAELKVHDPQMVQHFQDDPASHPFPGSEPSQVGAARAASALRRISAEFDGGRVVVVAHNTLLRLAICELLGLPVTRYRSLFPRLENAAVSEVRVPSDHRLASLLSLNVPVNGS
jgi:probable phosphoglycerate mutase